MNLPGVPDDFKLPEDPGELLAWMKNFATKLPLYAEKLGVSAADLAMVESMYEQMRASKEAEDAARLKVVERRLCAVPDAWPPPAALHDLMRKIGFIEEPERTRMIEEIERWTAGIERAQSPQVVPVLRGETWERGLRICFTPLPEPWVWVRLYWRPQGEAAWRLLCIVQRDYLLQTQPEPDDEEPRPSGVVEFVAVGLLEHENMMKAPVHGAPSAVLTMTVPTEYPVR